MKIRSFILLMSLLLGLNLWFMLSPSRLNSELMEKIKFAITFYKQEIFHQYLVFTGQIPTGIVAQHYHQWLRFQILCDALLLDRKTAEEWFAVYIRAWRDVNEEFRTEMMRNRSRNPGGPMPPREGPPRFERHLQNITERFLENLTKPLPEEVAGCIDLILTNREAEPDVNLCALRMVKLDDEQRQRIQPYSMQLMKARLDPPPPDPSLDEERSSPADEEDLLLRIVHETLTPQQLGRWKQNLVPAQKKVEEFHQTRSPYDSRGLATRGMNPPPPEAAAEPQGSDPVNRTDG